MAGKTWLVTGGAGFIGANATLRLAREGDAVVVYDNLSRPSAALNLRWLRQELGDDGFAFVEGDVRDAAALEAVVRERRPDVVLHLAGQVAVTTSIAAPREDYETNVTGSFNVLEAARLYAPAATVINVSTNKVYGQLEHHRIEEQATRYVDASAPDGVSESEPLDPHSPYGCSKAAADVYALDYARIYGLNSVSLRQSCIYGPRQFGIEDQGWVAWFALATRLGKPLTVYGNGKQVRDLLHVDDLVELYLQVAATEGIAGRAYNVGGGPVNTLSLLELLERLGTWRGSPVEPAFAEARPGDQLVFVADCARARADLGWEPRVGLDDGLERLFAWIAGDAAPQVAATA